MAPLVLTILLGLFKAKQLKKRLKNKKKIFKFVSDRKLVFDDFTLFVGLLSSAKS